VIFNKVVTA